MSQLPLSAESIVYPPEARSDTSRKQYKQKILRDRAEELFADHYKSGDVSNLIFLTQRPSAWHSTICSHYRSVKREGICNRWKIKIRDEEDPESVVITVNIYKNGTVMVQGDLRQFEKDFQTMKEKAQRENTTLSETVQEDKTSSSSCTSSEAPESESNPSCSEQAQIHHTMNIMKEQFTQLEIELVHLREQVNKWQPEIHTPEKMLSTELQAQLKSAHQERNHLKSKMADLTEEVRELQRERESNRAELRLLTERLQRREREVDDLQQQLHLHLTHCTNKDFNFSVIFASYPRLHRLSEFVLH